MHIIWPYTALNHLMELIKYVQFRFPAFSNIGIGSPFYQSTHNTTVLMRSIYPNKFTTYNDITNMHFNTNMFYMPYPAKTVDTTTLGETLIYQILIADSAVALMVDLLSTCLYNVCFNN